MLMIVRHFDLFEGYLKNWSLNDRAKLSLLVKFTHCQLFAFEVNFAVMNKLQNNFKHYKVAIHYVYVHHPSSKTIIFLYANTFLKEK